LSTGKKNWENPHCRYGPLLAEVGRTQDTSRYVSAYF